MGDKFYIPPSECQLNVYGANCILQCILATTVSEYGRLMSINIVILSTKQKIE